MNPEGLLIFISIASYFLYLYKYLYIYINIFAYIFKNGRFNKKLIKKTLKGDRGTKKKSRN